MLINCNALHIPLADCSVQMCVTSPPYYGLRDYGTATWIGGDSECDHNPQKPDGGDRSDRTLPLGRGGMYTTICGKCGAMRVDAQLGLEPTPDEYVANMVLVFREVKRVLRDDGTLWLNIGDSYFSDTKGTGGTKKSGLNAKRAEDGSLHPDRKSQPTNDGYRLSAGGTGCKPKDLIGIPWMLAFALRADGWYLRQDIIWAKAISGTIRKGSVMPESVQDRFCKSHEYLFLLSKSQRYYFDKYAVDDVLDNTKSHEYNKRYGNKDMQQMQAIETVEYVQQEQPTERWVDGVMQGMSIVDSEKMGFQIQPVRESARSGAQVLLFREGARNQKGLSSRLCSNSRADREIPDSGQAARERGKVQRAQEEIQPESKRKGDEGAQGQEIPKYRQGKVCQTEDRNQAQISNQIVGLPINKAGVGEHQREVQPDLCVLPQTEQSIRDGSCNTAVEGRNTHSGECSSIVSDMQRKEGQQRATRRDVWLIATRSYRGAHFATFPPDLIEPCILAGSKAGDIVLDPFVGSGTTVMVARRHGRQGIGLDLSLDYLHEQASKRIATVQPVIM